MTLAGKTARQAQVVHGRRIIKRDGRIIAATPVGADSPWLSCSSERARAFSRMLVRGVRSRALSGTLVALPLLAGASLARAQSIAPLVPITLDPVYNRGRNVSVAEQYDPAYQPLGFRMGSILAYPSVNIGTGASSNVYASDVFKRSDAFYLVQPVVRLTTDLPKHNLDFVAAGDIQRFAHETLRNQNNYSVEGSGRLDLGSDLKITGRLRYARQQESPYASDLGTDVSVLSNLRQFNASLNVVYTLGRARVTGRAERINFSFNNIVFADGTFRDQSDRNRGIDRLTGQVEYAVSPSIAAFVQSTYDITDFKNALRADLRPNRDSKAYQVLAGVNFDLAGLMRGSIGGGYTKRNYDAAFYNDTGGFIMQVQTEVFLSPLTTLGLGAQRTIQDSGSPFNGAYSDTRASANIDHALLRNLILSANLTRVNQELQDTHATSRLTLTSFSARYQTNRFINLGGSVQYAQGRPGDLPLGTRFNELRGQITVRFRR